jgi:hypothetical protein
MEKEYYLVALNHNDSKDPMKIDNVIYKGEMYDLPEIMEEAVLRSVYEPLEILAVKGMFGLRDLISGEVLIASNSGIENGLSYFKCVNASRRDIIRITKKYENMSNEDIKRYKDSIKRIKEKSVSNYLENQNRLIKEIYEEKCARDFLVRFQEWNA